jgi:hypothetical protein
MGSSKINSTYNVSTLFWHLICMGQIPHKFRPNVFTAHVNCYMTVIIRRHLQPHPDCRLLFQHFSEMLTPPWPILIVPQMVTHWEPIRICIELLLERLHVRQKDCNDLSSPPWKKSWYDFSLSKERLRLVVPGDIHDTPPDDIDVPFLKKTILKADGRDLFSTAGGADSSLPQP